MIIKTLIVGPFQCNCTILVCEKTREAVIIDAGDEFAKIKKELQILDIKLKYSLHTHAHLDHIGAVSELKRFTSNTKICLHKADQDLYEKLPIQGQMFGFQYDVPPQVDHNLEHEEKLSFGDHKFSVIHTPGHSPGGVCFQFAEGEISDKPHLFTGDTLFRESVGRSDLWGGDHRTLVKSIKDRIFTLEEETVVLPGHGSKTSVSYEARNNPFLK